MELSEEDSGGKARAFRIKKLLSYLNTGLYGKEEAVCLALLSTVANESIFFLGPPGEEGFLLKKQDVEDYQGQINKVVLSDEAKSVILNIKSELSRLNQDDAHKGEDAYYVSDRRWKKIVHILKTSAFLNGRSSVDLMDCSLIEYAIWNTSAQQKEVSGIVQKILKQNGIDCDNTLYDIDDKIDDFAKKIDSQWEKILNDSDFDADVKKTVLQAFDKEHYEPIANCIDKEIASLKDFRAKNEEPFMANAFANVQKYAPVIMEKVNVAIKELEDKKIELKKQHERYAGGTFIKNTTKANTSPVTLTVDMVEVKGGTFRNNVHLSPFYMARTPVTQELYEMVMGKNPSYFKGKKKPVESVNWYDAVEFCNELSKRDGLNACYTGSGDNIKCDFKANGYRLPTEAEWEYAACGGQNHDNFEYSGSNNIADVAWYNVNSGSKTHDVATKKPNSLGIFDMSGNVWELCYDWYGADYLPNGSSDPQGASSGLFRVSRGGSFSYDASDCAVSHRDYYGSYNAGSYLGFRVVRSSS